MSLTCCHSVQIFIIYMKARGGYWGQIINTFFTCYLNQSCRKWGGFLRNFEGRAGRFSFKMSDRGNIMGSFLYSKRKATRRMIRCRFMCLTILSLFRLNRQISQLLDAGPGLLLFIVILWTEGSSPFSHLSSHNSEIEFYFMFHPVNCCFIACVLLIDSFLCFFCWLRDAYLCLWDVKFVWLEIWNHFFVICL